METGYSTGGQPLVSQEVHHNWFSNNNDLFICERFIQRANESGILCFEEFLEPDTGYRFKINAVLTVDTSDYDNEYDDPGYPSYDYQIAPIYSLPWVKKRTTPKNIKPPVLETPVADGSSVRFISNLNITKITKYIFQNFLERASCPGSELDCFVYSNWWWYFKRRHITKYRKEICFSRFNARFRVCIFGYWSVLSIRRRVEMYAFSSGDKETHYGAEFAKF